MTRVKIGVVQALNLFPVKSMRGVAVTAAYCDWYGFDGDRKFGFVRADDQSSFPWLTGRQAPEMLLYQPYFVDPDNPRASPVHVKSPSGLDRPVADGAINYELSRQYGGPVNLMKLARGTYDSMPVSIITPNTVQAIAAAADERRFRANIVIAPLSDGPVPEQSWLGRELTFGDAADGAVVLVNRPIERCQMINLDPDSAASNPAVLREVARRFDANAGVYGSARQPGMIRVGDAVYRNP